MGNTLISCVALCGVAIMLLAAEAPPAGMKPIDVVYPKAGPVCSPRKLPPGIAYPKAPRGPVLAPEGCRILSRGRPVTSSDAAPVIGDLSQVTDGDKEGCDGAYVELAPGMQWVQLDLGASAPLYCIFLWQCHGQHSVYRDVIVQVSDDATFARGVTTVFNNDRDNSAGMGIGADREYVEHFEGQLIFGGGTRARYVRVYSNGNIYNDQNHYTEIEVWGTTQAAPAGMKPIEVKYPGSY